MWQTIKKILQKNKNAYIIVLENEKPVMVIAGFDEFEKKLGKELEKDEDSIGDNPGLEVEAKDEVYEDVNREIINLQAPEEQNLQIAEEKVNEITIEDIPVL